MEILQLTAIFLNASPVGFFRQASRYLKITRVVGRIPNIPGAANPDKIITILDGSARSDTKCQQL